MIDVERELRAALDRHESEVPLMDPADAAAIGRRARTRQALNLFGAGLAAAVVALGIVIGANAVLRAEPPTPAEPPAPQLPATPRDWSRSRLEPSHVHAITAGGPGLVAVGASSALHELADIWTSSDGRTWSRVPGEELGPGAINDVTTGGPGLVAVGDGNAGEGFQAAVWTSRDGLTWSRAPDDPVFDGAMEAVSAGGPGLVAVGHWHRAWFSSDGLTWDLASVPPVPPDVYPGDDGTKPQVYMSDVAAAGDRLVAVGGAMMNDNSEEAVVWTSAEGTTWTDVPLDPDVFPRGSSVRSVTGGPDGFIAIGEAARGGPPAMWTSEDGLRWRRVGSEQEPFRSTQPEPDAGRVFLSSITAGSGGYVAVGWDGPCNGVSSCNSIEAAIWTSQDGRSWVRVPTGPVFSDPGDPEQVTGASLVVPWGSVFVVAGEYDGGGAIWISEPLSE